MSTRSLHVIFGAGQIGPRVALKLKAMGHDVRLVRRAGGGPEDVPVVHGDAGDPAFAADVTKGAAAVYHCMNPAYDIKVWRREVPRLMSSLIGAAGRAGARLVVLDNVYMLGRPNGKPLRESTPVSPSSRKGEVRALANAQIVEAGQRGDVRAVVGRASDFYGPGGTGTYFGDVFWPNVFAKGVAEMPIDVDTPHTYHFTEDVAAALALLGTTERDVTGRSWMLPCAPAESSRAMIARFARALGRDLKVRVMPRPLLSLLALFVPIVREIGEMAYQWDEPFVVDDSEWRAAFRGAVPVTTLDAGANATVEWARGRYPSRSR